MRHDVFALLRAATIVRTRVITCDFINRWELSLPYDESTSL